MKHILIVLLLLPLVASADQVLLYPKVRKATKDFVSITKIELDKAHTKVSLRYITQEEGWVRAQPPKNKHSFVIRTPKRDYPLMQVEGLAVAPKKTRFLQGDTIDFTLYFKAIPNDTKVIDVVERIKKSEAWSFLGVQIKPNQLVSNYYTMFQNKKDFKDYYLYNRKDLSAIEGFWKLKMDMNITLADGKKHKVKLLKEEDSIAIVKENDTYLCYTLDGYLISFGIIELPLEKGSYKMVFLIEGHRYVTPKFKLEKKFEKEWSLPDFYKMIALGKNYDKKAKVKISSKWRMAGRR